MIKTAAQKPDERKRYIDRCLNQYAELNKDPVVEAWRMKVDNKMTQARISRTTLVWMARQEHHELCAACPHTVQRLEMSLTYLRRQTCDHRNA